MIVAGADGHFGLPFFARQDKVYLILLAVHAAVQYVAVGFHFLLFANTLVEQVGERVEPVQGCQYLQQQEFVEVSVPDVADFMRQHERQSCLVGLGRKKDGAGKRERRIVMGLIQIRFFILADCGGAVPYAYQIEQLQGDVEHEDDDACDVPGEKCR